MSHVASLLSHLCLRSTRLTVFILRGRGTGISTTPAGAPLVSSLACLGERSTCGLGVWASASCTFGAISSSVGCFCGVSVAVEAGTFVARSDSCGLGGRSLSWGLGGRSDSCGLGGNSDSCGFGGRSESWGLGGSSRMCGLGGISPGWGLSVACGILGGGSVGLVMVSLVGMSTTWVGFCRTSGPRLGLSTEGAMPGVFLNATEKEGQHVLLVYNGFVFWSQVFRNLRHNLEAVYAQIWTATLGYETRLFTFHFKQFRQFLQWQNTTRSPFWGSLGKTLGPSVDFVLLEVVL